MQRISCECGGSMGITGPLTNRMLIHFNDVHRGEGHLDRVTAPQAARIREKAREESRLEYRRDRRAVETAKRKAERLAIKRERNEIELQALLAEERALAKELPPQ